MKHLGCSRETKKGWWNCQGGRLGSRSCGQAHTRITPGRTLFLSPRIPCMAQQHQNGRLGSWPHPYNGKETNFVVTSAWPPGCINSSPPAGVSGFLATGFLLPRNGKHLWHHFFFISQVPQCCLDIRVNVNDSQRMAIPYFGG